MTFPAEKIGDRGQRYVGQGKGYPDHTRPDEWQNMCYGSNRDGLVAMTLAFLSCPGCVEVRVHDREDGTYLTFDD